MLRSKLAQISVNSCRRSVSSNAFNSSRSTSNATATARRSGTVAVALTGVLGATAYLSLRKPVHADNEEGIVITPTERSHTPFSALLRSYVVFAMCSSPTIVDHAPAILATLSAIPGLKQIAEAVVRATFFAQFVGGESAADAVPLLARMRSENIGALFAYSVEVNEDEAAGTGKASVRGRVADAERVLPPHKQAVDEMIRCINVAADFEDGLAAGRKTATGRRTWVAIKLTALVPDAHSLVHLSSHLVHSRKSSSSSAVCFPGCPAPSDLSVLSTPDALMLPPSSALTVEDLRALSELRDDLRRICKRARERGIRVIMDAEHSWYTPAVDAFQLEMMREFNRVPPSPSKSTSLLRALGISSKNASESSAEDADTVQPLVYGTFQAYLRRNDAYLAQSLADARAGGYALGVKLVRGAYHPLETLAHAQALTETRAGALPTSPAISPEDLPPVWTFKAETDACYARCTRVLLGEVERDVKDARGAKGARAPGVGVLFGTHNPGSCALALDELVSRGVALRETEQGGGKEVVRIPDDVAERVTIGQLYGMSDALTDALVARVRSADPFVIKYIPYGALAEVMPYLGRRATENKSVLGNGQADEERRRAGAEIARRTRAFFALA